MFAPMNANTIMHVGEYRAGIPLLDLVCPILEDGMHREALVPDCPWHVNFEAAYKSLYARNQLKEARLGENTIRTMLCTDAIAAQEEVMRETPELLIQPRCVCPYCSRLREYCEVKH
jgi:hypothetical protein